MEVLEQKKEKPYHEQLLEIKPGKKDDYPWEKRRSVRGAISDKLLNDFPGAKFTTLKIEKVIDGVKVKRLQVTRIS